MGWLFRRVLVCILSLTLLVGAAVVIMRSPDVPTLAAWFTYADGSPCPMPCLFGIRPGVTAFSEVARLLDAHPYIRNKNSYAEIENAYENQKGFLLRNEGQFIGDVVFTADQSNLVETISIVQPTIRDKRATFLTMLLAFGFPRSVALSYYNNYDDNQFTYNQETIFINVADNKHACQFSLEAEITSIYIFAPSYYSDLLTQPMAETPPDYFPWIGFSRQAYFERYYAPQGSPVSQCGK